MSCPFVPSIAEPGAVDNMAERLRFDFMAGASRFLGYPAATSSCQ
jgi:hypothetical protein